MAPNNQTHLFMYSFNVIAFLNVISNMNIEGGYYGQWLSSSYISALLSP